MYQLYEQETIENARRVFRYTQDDALPLSCIAERGGREKSTNIFRRLGVPHAYHANHIYR